MKLNYIPDREINLENNDLLGAKPYVDILSEIITNSETPFTIGLFGGWGVGKSSIIKTIKEKFNNDDNSEIEVFTYDAWKYLNDSFRRTFLLNILEYFNLDTEEIKSRFYTNKVKNVTWGISKIVKYQKANSITYNRTIEPEIFEGIFKETIEQITNNKSYTWKYFKELIGFKKRIRKIVIVIDNIDRCHNELAFELLLTIKNFLEQKGVIFIIPIDENEIKKQIKKQGNNPNEFLRKLFNTTIVIKDISESDLFDFAKKLNDNYQLGFSPEIISIVAQQFSKNPRKIIQFLNVLQTEILLSKNQESKELIPTGTITKNLPFLTKILIIREEWPDLYHNLKNNSYTLKNIYDCIIKNEKNKYHINNYEIDIEQRNYLRRTNHIIPNHTNFELFFINKDSFRDIPDKTNSLVESNDIEGIKQQLKNKEIKFDKLIEFIDKKFETALKRGEIKTTIVNILSLIFSMATDKELKQQTKKYINNSGKFLGGFNNFILSSQTNQVIELINSKILFLFIKENKNLSVNILRSAVSAIDRNNNKKIIIDYIEAYRNDPNKLQVVSAKFSHNLSDSKFMNKVKHLLNEEIVVQNLIKPKLIEEYIVKIKNDIESEDSNQKLEFIILYNKVVGLSKKQAKGLVAKLISYINSTNDYIKTPYWLGKLIKFIPNAKDDTVLADSIYSTLNGKQSWLWSYYSSLWNREDYKTTLNVFLTAITEFYTTIPDNTKKNQIIIWLTQYFNRNESAEIMKFINNLFYDITDSFAVYKWPFSGIVINKFTQVGDWELKKEMAKTLNLMLLKTKNDKGLNEQQIESIFTKYINIINENNQKDIINWISKSLENQLLIKHFDTIINKQSDEKKIEVLEILTKLNKTELIEDVIISILKNISCENLESVFIKIERANVNKDTIIKSIKKILRDIELESDNFKCLLEYFSVSKFTNNVISNLIAEKVKNLLATDDNNEIIFALKIINKINISDERKLKAIKALIQDINETSFQGIYLKLVKRIKRKYE